MNSNEFNIDILDRKLIDFYKKKHKIVLLI